MRLTHLLILSALLASIASASHAANTVSIIYTANANGYLESCDCPNNPYGGLARRITVLKELKSQNPDSVLIDAGDFMPARSDAALAHYCAASMRTAGYDAIAIGEQDIAFPLTGLPILPSNLSLGSPDSREHPGFIIKTVNGVRVGITCITLLSLISTPGPGAQDHQTFLLQTLPQLRRKSDLIIVVSHCGLEEDKRIAEAFPDIDVIAGGHSKEHLIEPLRVNQTTIVNAGEQGHRVGILAIEMGTHTARNRLILLDKGIANDPAIAEFARAYRAELKQKAKRLVR